MPNIYRPQGRVHIADPDQSPRIRLRLAEGDAAVFELIAAGAVRHLFVGQRHHALRYPVAVHPVGKVFIGGAVVVPDEEAHETEQGGHAAIGDAAADEVAAVALPQGVEADTQHGGHQTDEGHAPPHLVHVDAQQLLLCRNLAQRLGETLLGGVAAVGSAADDEGDDLLQPSFVDERLCLLVHPLRLRGVGRTDHDEETGTQQFLMQLVRKDAAREVSAVAEDRAQVFLQARMLLTDDGRQLISLQFLLQPFGPLFVLALVAYESIIGVLLSFHFW